MKSVLKVALVFVLWGTTFFASQLSLDHLRGDNSCPMFLGLPLCVIVFVLYFVAALASIFLALGKTNLMVWLGLASLGSVLFIAGVGRALEIINGHTCPRTESGTPMCFLSLVVASLAFVLFELLRRQTQRTTQERKQ